MVGFYKHTHSGFDNKRNYATSRVKLVAEAAVWLCCEELFPFATGVIWWRGRLAGVPVAATR